MLSPHSSASFTSNTTLIPSIIHPLTRNVGSLLRSGIRRTPASPKAAWCSRIAHTTVCFLPNTPDQPQKLSRSGNMGSSARATAARGGTLSVLTLNIWGLWLVSKRRSERVGHLANYLSHCKEDIVLLQEVWVDADAQLLIAAGKAAGLVHATHFRSGMFGSGLVTLSRHPILRHAFWRYAAGGFATSITCGDYYAGKGVGWVRLATPLGEADVFNTHLHANYCHDYRLPPPDLRRAAAAAASALEKGSSGADASKAAAEAMVRGTSTPEWAGSRIPDDDDAGVRVCQLMELSEVIDLVSSSSSSGGSGSNKRLVILGGDLNCKPHTFEIDLLRLRLPQLCDAWAAAAVRSSDGSANIDDSGSEDSAAALLGVGNPEGFTCHAPGNTFQPRRQVPERIDYVWSNMVTHRADVTLQLCPTSSSSGGRGRGGKQGGLLSYSDHFAVRAVLGLPGDGAAAARSAGSSPERGARKLSTSVGAAADQQQQQVLGEGAAMPLPKRVATAYAAVLMLQEGFEAFVNNGRAMLALGGFVLATLVYVGVGLPILWPELTLTGASITAAVAVTAFVTGLGLLMALMGQVGDKSQQRAMQSGLRLLRVWMEQQGIAALPQQLSAAATGAAGTPPPPQPQQPHRE